MGFKKGQSGNREGRKRGTPNKVTGKLREALADFLEDKVNELPAIFQKLKPDQKIDALVKIASFVLPKMSTLALEPGMTIEKFVTLPEEDREEYLSGLRRTLEIENNSTLTP